MHARWTPAHCVMGVHSFIYQECSKSSRCLIDTSRMCFWPPISRTTVTYVGCAARLRSFLWWIHEICPPNQPIFILSSTVHVFFKWCIRKVHTIPIFHAMEKNDRVSETPFRYSKERVFVMYSVQLCILYCTEQAVWSDKFLSESSVSSKASCCASWSTLMTIWLRVLNLSWLPWHDLWLGIPPRFYVWSSLQRFCAALANCFFSAVILMFRKVSTSRRADAYNERTSASRTPQKIPPPPT